jgi:hypothetical protein
VTRRWTWREARASHEALDAAPARRGDHPWSARAAWVAAAAFGLGAACAALPGCATVSPIERQFLGDPIMSFERDARADLRNLHWIEAREGSTGGAGGAGGGCACN